MVFLFTVVDTAGPVAVVAAEVEAAVAVDMAADIAGAAAGTGEVPAGMAVAEDTVASVSLSESRISGMLLASLFRV